MDTGSIEFSFSSIGLVFIGSWLFCVYNYISVCWGPNSLACQKVLKGVWSSINQYTMFFIQTSTLTLSMH